MAGLRAVLGIWLLFGGVCVTSASTISIPLAEYKVARGDNATLPCQLSPPPSATSTINSVTWSASPDKPEDPMMTIVTYRPLSIKTSTKYKGRANLILDASAGKFDLQLFKVTSADTRRYECEADIEQENDNPSDTAKLIVLVAPSTPICAVEGKAEYFQDLKLSCRSEEGTPTPVYKWQSYDVNNVPRPLPPKATDQNGVLSLFNVSKDASGYYICTSTNEIRSARCNLTLAVMPPSINMASAGGIIGAVVGAALLLTIIIVICCCCRRRRKEKQEEYAMGAPEGGEFTDHDPDGKEDEHVNYEEERHVKSAERPQDERSERSYDRRSDYDERRDRSDDRRDRYDRDERYDDRRSDYDDRRDRNDDRRDRYDDRRERHDDRRDRNDDRRDRNDDRRDRYDDRRDRYDDHYDSDRYDSRDRPPSVPPNKPRDPRN